MSLDVFFQETLDAGEEGVDARQPQLVFKASFLKKLFSLYNELLVDFFALFPRQDKTVGSLIMGREHVVAIRFTCFSHFNIEGLSPPFGVIHVENALKWLKGFEDGVAVYDFSERLGRIRVGDVVYKEEEETSITEIGSILNGFEPVIADVRLSTETLLSTLRMFEKDFDYVMFSFRDGVLSVSSKLEYHNKSLERSLKVSGRGKVDKQYFGLHYLLRYLKSIDRMGIKGVRLLFSEGPQEFSKDPQKISPKPIIIESKIKDMEITLYQAPRIMEE